MCLDLIVRKRCLFLFIYLFYNWKMENQDTYDLLENIALKRGNSQNNNNKSKTEKINREWGLESVALYLP